MVDLSLAASGCPAPALFESRMCHARLVVRRRRLLRACVVSAAHAQRARPRATARRTHARALARLAHSLVWRARALARRACARDLARRAHACAFAQHARTSALARRTNARTAGSRRSRLLLSAFDCSLLALLASLTPLTHDAALVARCLWPLPARDARTAGSQRPRLSLSALGCSLPQLPCPRRSHFATFGCSVLAMLLPLAHDAALVARHPRPPCRHLIKLGFWSPLAFLSRPAHARSSPSSTAAAAFTLPGLDGTAPLPLPWT